MTEREALRWIAIRGRIGNPVPKMWKVRSPREKSENPGASDDDKKEERSGRSHIRGNEEHLARRHCRLWERLEHQTRDYEEREADRGAMLAKLNVPGNSEVGTMAERVGATRGDRKME